MGKIEKNLEFEIFFEIFFEDLGLFSNLYSLQEVVKNEKNLKFPFQKKKSVAISKLDLGFGS